MECDFDEKCSKESHSKTDMKCMGFFGQPSSWKTFKELITFELSTNKIRTKNLKNFQLITLPEYE